MNVVSSVVRARGSYRTFSTWRDVSPNVKAVVMMWVFGTVCATVTYGSLAYIEINQLKLNTEEAKKAAAAAEENATSGRRLAALAEATAEEWRNHHASVQLSQARNSTSFEKVASSAESIASKK